METALGRIIKKSPDYMDALDTIPDDAPDWLRRKWELSTEWHKFNPRANIKLPGMAFAVAEWLDKAILYEQEWLKNVDEKGRPKKLLKISSVPQLWTVLHDDEKLIKDKIRIRAREALQDESVGVDACEVMSFSNGYRIVKLLTERALDRESAFLEHCIGDGAYDDSLQDGQRYYYSLRDGANQPCATMAVVRDSANVTQISGFRNQLPDMKYMRYLATFCYHCYLDMSVAIRLSEGYERPAAWDTQMYPHLQAPSDKSC